MARRKSRLQLSCEEPGCKEFSFWEFGSDRAMFESDEYQRHKIKRQKFFCIKHEDRDRVLSPTRLRVEWVSDPVREEPYGKFFGNHGVIIGTGYYAQAEDFPVGTRVKITAEIIQSSQVKKLRCPKCGQTDCLDCESKVTCTVSVIGSGDAETQPCGQPMPCGIHGPKEERKSGPFPIIPPGLSKGGVSDRPTTPPPPPPVGQGGSRR